MRACGFPEVMNYRTGQVASQNHRPHPVNSLWRGPPTKRQQQFQYEQQQSFYQQQLLATLLLRQRRTTGGSINLQFYHHHKDTANKSTTTTKTSSPPPPPVLLYKLLDYNNYYNYCRTVNNSSTFNKLQRNVAVAAAAVQTTVAPFLYVHIPITTQIATVAGDHMGYRRNRYKYTA